MTSKADKDVDCDRSDTGIEIVSGKLSLKRSISPSSLSPNSKRIDCEDVSDFTVVDCENELRNEPHSASCADNKTVNTSDKSEMPKGKHRKKTSISVPVFELQNFLPSKIPKPHLSKPDKLREQLTGFLKSNLEDLIDIPNESIALDLTLPLSEYSSQLENNLSLLFDIIKLFQDRFCSANVCCIVLPQVDKFSGIDKLSELFEKLKVAKNVLQIEVIFNSESTDDILMSMKNVIVSFNKIYKESAVKLMYFENRSTTKLLRPTLSKELKPQLTKYSKTCTIMYGGFTWGLNISRIQTQKAQTQKPPTQKAPTQKAPTQKATTQKALTQKTSTARKSLPRQTKQSSKAIYTYDGKFYDLKGVRDSQMMSAYDYWQLESIHELYTGEGTVLAIVDTGVQKSHFAFRSSQKIIYSGNFAEYSLDCTTDQNGHGTLCAGIACGLGFSAYENPATGDSAEVNIPPGVAPDAKLIVCKVTAGGEDYYTDDAMGDALKYLKDNYTGDNDQKVDVVSISLGSHSYSDKVALAITDLVHAGVIVVCAASNSGHKCHTPISYPARLGHVLCIGSHGIHGKTSPFSPVGQSLDFLAPGENIVGPGNLSYPNEATCGNGTSLSTPAVAGLICLI